MALVRPDPVSLVAGRNSDARRAYIEIAAPNGPPDQSKSPPELGFLTLGHRYLRLTLELDGTSVDYLLWTYDKSAARWRPHQSGTKILSTAIPTPADIEIIGSHGVYLEFLSVVLGGGVGVTAWLSGVTY